MTQMSMGSNIALSADGVRASLRWNAGSGVPDVDASAILLEADGEIGSDADFVFYNQPEHPSGAVRMAGKTTGPAASDQIDVDLTRVPSETQRIVLAASADGGPFGRVPGLEIVLLDLATNAVLAVFPMHANDETAFVSAELYRRSGAWKFRAVGQGYSSGLAGLAADFGIDAADDPADPPPTAAAPATAPQAPQPHAPQPVAAPGGGSVDLSTPAQATAPLLTPAVPVDLDGQAQPNRLPTGPPATSDTLDLSVPFEYTQPPRQ